MDNSPIPSAGSVTLTLGGCSYEGPKGISAGKVSITLTNETQDAVNFDFLQLHEGRSFEELAARIRKEHARVETEEPPLRPPPFAEMLSTVAVGPTESGGFAATVDGGIYGFVCGRIDKSDHVAAIFAAGLLEVTK